jgi:hypothetical protein
MAQVSLYLIEEYEYIAQVPFTTAKVGSHDYRYHDLSITSTAYCVHQECGSVPDLGPPPDPYRPLDAPPYHALPLEEKVVVVE